jgi:hypothetical protein
MKRVKGVFTVVALLAAACGGEEKPTPDIGQAAAEIVSDTEVLKEAQAAANDLIRSAPECEAVTALFAEVKRKLDEAAARVQTEAGRTTLQALRSRIKPIGEACGVQ